MSNEEKNPASEPKVQPSDNDNAPEPPVAPLLREGSSPAPVASGKKKFDLKAFLKTKKGKVVAVFAALVLIVGVVFAVPVSRYAIAGLVIKKDLTVEVVDSKTGKPVSAAQLTLGANMAKTDANGKATFKNVPVGNWMVSAQKAHHQNAKIDALIPILSDPAVAKITVVATGRQVPVSVVNKISGKAVPGVEITVGDVAATTADDGKAVLVLPADKDEVSADLKASGYNTVTANVTVAEQEDSKNIFSLTPAGKVYFLSKRTGKLNVMSANLDGSNQTLTVEGTGKENDRTTVLLASRDWKYLALLANRDSDQQKLYLITTADNKLTLIDEGATFGLAGWYNDQFIYTVTRNVKEWEPKRQSLKSLNAANTKITSLDDTAAAGSSNLDWQHEILGNVYILENQLIYTKHWNKTANNVAPLAAGKKDGIYAVKPNGENRQTLKEFDFNGGGYIDARLYRPQEVYFRVSLNTASTFYEYEDGKIEETKSVDDNSYYTQEYPTYLVSPSGKSTLWSEDRDGKQVVFKGDAAGANGKEVIATDEYAPYGWYSDDYLLLSKGGSQLFIVPADVSGAPTPLKVTDYHRPSSRFPGYGYGYGGL